MKYIDLPPVWLALASVAVWASRSIVTAGQGWWPTSGAVLIAMGLGLMVAAAWSMFRARTTIIPHRVPDALVTSGIFGFTRNPIYLGDVLILTGLCLRWDAPLGFAAVPIFVWWMTRHFIFAEEMRLSAAFGHKFQEYEENVRRWI